jgi:xylulokinase
MGARYLIGLDASTQSVKAIVWDFQGTAIAEGRAALAIRTPAPGWAEQDAASWQRASARAIRQAVTGLPAESIAALGLTWQRETFVAVDARGHSLRPAILWFDQRATREVAAARAEFGAERFQRLSGKQLDTTPAFVKLLWMRRNEPELYSRIHAVWDVGAYLARRLTGRSCTCLAGGDSLGLLDLAQGQWSEGLLGYAGLSAAQMPDWVGPAQPIGALTPQAARATGLLAGTPVIAAGGDGQVFAVGVQAETPDLLSLTVGTSLVLGAHWPHYRVGPAYRTMAGAFPGAYLLEGVLRAGAEVIRWFVHDFAPGRRERDWDAAIEAIPPGCQGLITLPYWKGRMMPTNDPLARGATIGWSDYHTLAHYYRSLLEGIAFEVRLLIACYAQELGIRPRELRLGGGGALSAAWRQIIADVSGLEVVTSNAESTSLGAAMLAAAGCGGYASVAEASRAMYHPRERIRPRAEAQAIYDRLYGEYYARLYPALGELLSGLGRWVLQ